MEIAGATLTVEHPGHDVTVPVAGRHPGDDKVARRFHGHGRGPAIDVHVRDVDLELVAGRGAVPAVTAGINAAPPAIVGVASPDDHELPVGVHRYCGGGLLVPVVLIHLEAPLGIEC
jgi:hypothetical protein